MSQVTISDVATQVRGVSYGKEDVQDRPADDYLPVLRANNITDSGLSFDDLVFVKKVRIRDAQRLKAGDIVIAASSGSLSVVGKAAQVEEDHDAAFGAFCKVVRPGPNIHPAYLGHFFRTPAYRAKISSLAAGANINNLRSEHINDLSIPLPPMPEQRRIAAILDQADALRRLRRQSLSRLSDLGQAIFSEMFGSGSESSDKSLVPLSRFAQLINGDRSANYPSGDDIVDNGVLFLSTRNIIGGEIDLTFRQFITTDKFDSLGGGKLLRGDIVITLRGSIGLSAVFDTHHDTGFINAQLMIIRCGSALLPQYLQKYLSLPSTQHRLKRVGSGSAVPQLTGAQMKDFMVLAPPLDEQRAFIEAYSKLQAHSDRVLAEASRCDTLFASLQHRAFRGEL